MKRQIGSVAERLHVDASRLAPLDVLPEQDLERFEATITHALEFHDAAFDRGLRGALRIVPKPLRGPARALLFPGGE